MTRRLTISLPDDVAADLDPVDNASAYIADALRRYGRARRIRANIAARGIVITDEGCARMGERLREHRRRRAEAEAAMAATTPTTP